MAENIFGGVEYESEPHPGYEIDGKPVYYAKNVPDLLRGDLTLTGAEQARIPELQALFEDHPLKLAERGADDWNLWVKATADRWLAQEVHNGMPHVRLRPTEGNQFADDDFYAKNGIDFTEGLEANEEGRFDISVDTFDGFIFPCVISFKKATFSGDAGFDGATFSGDAGFDGATFSGDAWFREATFSGTAGFDGATFSGDAGFDGAKFRSTLSYHRAAFFGGARWYDAEFAKTVQWNDASFWAGATFENSQFNAAVDLDGASFGQKVKPPRPEEYAGWPDAVKQAYDDAPLVSANSRTIPNFKGANFLVAPNLGYTKVAVPEHKYLAWYEHLFAKDGLKARPIAIGDEDAASKLRRLQELAKAGHHSYAERQFFRAELLCRRGHEAKSWREIQLIWGFEAFSECGSAIVRPLLWWGAVFAFFLAIYGRIAGVLDTQISWDEAIHLFNYTFSNGTPLLGVIKAGDSGAIHALFGGKLPPLVALLGGVHNLLSTAFIFFALLGVRNYFKVS